MHSIEWRIFPAFEEMADAAASRVVEITRAAVSARGAALLALPGGNTPKPIFEKIAVEKSVDWPAVTIIPTDERLVPEGSPLSNSAMLGQYFAPLNARVLAMGLEPMEAQAAGRILDMQFSALDWPADLVWTGVGNDGHTASLLPGPDLEMAMSERLPIRIVGVRPEPLPQEAPFDRVTLTKAALLSARHIIVVAAGDEKKRVLDQAIAEGSGSLLPFGRLVAASARPIEIFWTP